MKNSICRLTLLACAAFFILAGSPSRGLAQEIRNLRIVFVSLSWNNQLPYRIAIAKGFFKDQGLTVEQIFVRGGPTAIAALVSGNVEFGSIGGAQAPIRSNVRGLDLQILASLSNYTNYTLLGSKETRSIEQLHGKLIGVTGAGAYSDFAIRIFLKRHNIDPDRDVTLRAIALERGVINAAPFTAEDTIKFIDKGFPMIVNLNEALRIPQSVLVTRGEMLQKYPETSKRFLKAMILGMQVAKHNKKEAIQIGLSSGIPGDPELVNRPYDLFSPGYAADLSVAHDGIQIMLDEDIRAGVVDKKFTLDRVINERILKQAQQELKSEGRLKP